MTAPAAEQAPLSHLPTSVDVVIVGAGFAGLYMLLRLRRMNMTAVVIEAGDDVEKSRAIALDLARTEPGDVVHSDAFLRSLMRRQLRLSVACALAFMGMLISFLGARILRDFHVEERADLQVITWGMIPRGLPGVVLASLAMSSGMVGPTTYLALVLMVALTNLIGLAGLTWRVRHPAQKFFSA